MITKHQLILWLIVVIYLLGFLFKLKGMVKNLLFIGRLISQYGVMEQNHYKLVYIWDKPLQAFCFGPYIFLSTLHNQLSLAERRQVIFHEQIHVRLKHTVDLLFYEVAGVLLWFNPIMRHLAQRLKDVHEFQADHAVMQQKADVQSYGNLLIKLAMDQSVMGLTHSFSQKQLFNRISMLTQPTSTPMQKLRFLFILPVAAVTCLATACMDSQPSDTRPQITAQQNATHTTSTLIKQGRLKIGNISWQGNKVITSERLTEVLAIKVGDRYDSLGLESRLNNLADRNNITSLYMDQGYMYFSLEPKKTVLPDGTISLDFNIAEGKPVKIRNILVKGNQHISTEQVLEYISIQSNEWFSRTKIMQAQEILAQSGYFDARQVDVAIHPQTSPEKEVAYTDLEFSLIENNK